jgi:hypothetical protein
MAFLLTIAPLIAGLTIVLLAIIKKLRPQEALNSNKYGEEGKKNV